jgi:hypothetical protein
MPPAVGPPDEVRRSFAQVVVARDDHHVVAPGRANCPIGLCQGLAFGAPRRSISRAEEMSALCNYATLYRGANPSRVQSVFAFNFLNL